MVNFSLQVNFKVNKLRCQIGVLSVNFIVNLKNGN